jgi:hypothetical protein
VKAVSTNAYKAVIALSHAMKAITEDNPTPDDIQDRTAILADLLKQMAEKEPAQEEPAPKEDETPAPSGRTFGEFSKAYKEGEFSK